MCRKYQLGYLRGQLDAGGSPGSGDFGRDSEKGTLRPDGAFIRAHQVDKEYTRTTTDYQSHDGNLQKNGW